MSYVAVAGLGVAGLSVLMYKWMRRGTQAEVELESVDDSESGKPGAIQRPRSSKDLDQLIWCSKKNGGKLVVYLSATW